MSSRFIPSFFKLKAWREGEREGKDKEDRRTILQRKVSEKEKEEQKGIRNTHFIPFCPR